MRVLVTGGAGFIGSTLCRQLISRGGSVHVFGSLGEEGYFREGTRTYGLPLIICDRSNNYVPYQFPKTHADCYLKWP